MYGVTVCIGYGLQYACTFGVHGVLVARYNMHGLRFAWGMRLITRWWDSNSDTEVPFFSVFCVRVFKKETEMPKLPPSVFFSCL